MRGGISFPPWLRFRRPPDNPGRPAFPGPVRNLSLSSVSLPSVREIQALARIHPDVGGLPTASFHRIRRLIAGSESDHRAADEPPRSRVPLPQFGVTSLEETCAASWEDITLPSSLLWTHAPNPSGSPLLRLLPRSGSPCRLLPAPAASGLFPTLSLRVFPEMPGPLLRRLAGCMCLLLPLQHRPSLEGYRSAYRKHPLKRLHSGRSFRSCSHFFMFRPPSLLATLVAPTTQFPAQQTVTSTSEQSMLRYLSMHRIC